MRLKLLDVDLRSYSGVEFERRYHLLDVHSWTMTEDAYRPGVFNISIDLDAVRVPLPELFDVPQALISAGGST